MRTPGMSDEELDALFRRGAETYPDEIHLGAWARMEDKLNEDTLNRLVRRKITKFFALELVLVGLALLVWQFAWHRDTPTPSTNPKPASAAISHQPDRAVVLHAPSPASDSASPIHNTALEPTNSSSPSITGPLTAQSQPQIARPNKAATSPTAVVQQLSNRASLRIATPRPGRILSTKQRRTTGTHKTHATNSDARSSLTSTTAQPSTGAAFKEESNSPSEAQTPHAASTEPTNPAVSTIQQQATSLLVPAQDTTIQQPAAPTPTAVEDSAQEKPRVKPAYRLLIGALGAPSLSAVRSVQTARMGGDLGLSLEYRLTDRLRVRASIIRSVKRYKVASEYYTAPATWGWRSGEYEVNGNCRITEIPLDLRYDIISKPTHTVFFSAGMNSLLMRNERYSYDYYLNGKARTAAIRVENGANFVLSVVNLSAGAERQLSNHLSLQAEPFVQMPLGGVGAAKVRLSSAGLLFSLKYGFLPSHRAVVP